MRERERERSPSRLHAVSAEPHMRLNPTNHERVRHDLSQNQDSDAQLTEPPRWPKDFSKTLKGLQNSWKDENQL